MSESAGVDGLDIQALATKMLGGNGPETEVEETEEEVSTAGHPAWQEILDTIPQEYRNAVLPTLQKWDAGVSRQFQKIHDSYAPLREFEDLDPAEVRDALGVYQALNENPEATWEAIGRVYGLSPQQISQAMASEDEEVEDYLNGLPAGIRDRLSKLDVHEQVLENITRELLQRQASEEEAQEDEALEEYLEELHEEYGDFDEDFVVGLMAAGVDGEDAIGQFQQITERIAQQYGESTRRSSPSVMSSSGGIPNVGSVDPSRLSSRDTQDLISEILRQNSIE